MALTSTQPLIMSRGTIPPVQWYRKISALTNRKGPFVFVVVFISDGRLNRFVFTEEADDDDDPEYNFLDDLDEPDMEDYRTDRAVQITSRCCGLGAGQNRLLVCASALIRRLLLLLFQRRRWMSCWTSSLIQWVDSRLHASLLHQT